MTSDQHLTDDEPDADFVADDDASDAIARKMVLSHWRQLQRNGITVHSLQLFYAQFKYLVMSRDIESYRRIGILLATVTPADLPTIAQQTREIIMTVLQKPPTRGGNANALQHIRGYLKRALTATEKRALTESIEKYRQGDTPLSAPLTLLREHFRLHPDAYIERQVFMRMHFEASPIQNSR